MNEKWNGRLLNKWNSSERLGEHESMMSFNNDIGNYVFIHWWEECGKQAFEEWADANEDEMSDLYS